MPDTTCFRCYLVTEHVMQLKLNISPFQHPCESRTRDPTRTLNPNQEMTARTLLLTSRIYLPNVALFESLNYLP